VHASIIKLLWFVLAVTMAWGVNHWRHAAALESLASAQAGDRGEAESWILRRVRKEKCRLHEARAFLSADSRRFVARPDFVSLFVTKLYEGGAVQVEICQSAAADAAPANYLVITLPEADEAQEGVIADAQSFVRRDALVYGGVSETAVEEHVRAATLVGERRVMVQLPGVSDSPTD
jgi:hypothetical protein